MATTTTKSPQPEDDSRNKDGKSSPLSSSALSASQCPYAVALSEDEASHHEASLPSDIAAELSHCPAFVAPDKKLTCPFKEAKSPEEVQKTLAQIPKSHHRENGAFYQVIRNFHQIHEQGADKDFMAAKGKLPKQCPMQPYIEKTHPHFAQAFEDCSLAAIMAKLAADCEDGKDDESVDSTSADEKKSEGGVGVEELNPVEKETSKPISSSEAQEATEEEPPKQRDSLAQALKTGTAASHQAAEDVHFVRNFIRGQIDRELYRSLIMSLYHVYVALEDALDQHAPQHFASCHFPDALRRVPSLKEDVEFWHNTTDPSPRTISPATQDYIDRVQYLSHHDPLLLLAHSYTRYLGDLSGGRVLARVARRALDLGKGTEGLAFYQFHKVQSYKKFKDEYRRALDELPLTSQQIRALVAEANVAFCLNMRLFQELDVMATIPEARVMSLEEVMSYAHKGIEEEEGKKEEEKCPFLVKQKQQPATATQSIDNKRCPWPFIFAHDPAQGMKDWQTWAFIFIAIAVWLQRH